MCKLNEKLETLTNALIVHDRDDNWKILESAIDEEFLRAYMQSFNLAAFEESNLTHLSIRLVGIVVERRLWPKVCFKELCDHLHNHASSYTKGAKERKLKLVCQLLTLLADRASSLNESTPLIVLAWFAAKLHEVAAMDPFGPDNVEEKGSREDQPKKDDLNSRIDNILEDVFGKWLSLLKKLMDKAAEPRPSDEAVTIQWDSTTLETVILASKSSRLGQKQKIPALELLSLYSSRADTRKLIHKKFPAEHLCLMVMNLQESQPKTQKPLPEWF
jgi:hypothetical protein